MSDVGRAARRWSRLRLWHLAAVVAVVAIILSLGRAIGWKEFFDLLGGLGILGIGCGPGFYVLARVVLPIAMQVRRLLLGDHAGRVPLPAGFIHVAFLVVWAYLAVFFMGLWSLAILIVVLLIAMLFIHFS